MKKLTEFQNWIFDLDNTLYKGDQNFFSQIDKKMTEYVARFLSLDPVDARKLQKQYLADYGTTMSGLMKVHDMEPTEFLYYVHDVDLSLLSPDAELRRQIQTLPGRKFIFTNGSQGHAKNVGTHLNLYDLFDGVFGIEDGDYIPKPQSHPYEVFCKRFNIDPTQAIMFEDGVKNLKVPKDMGMKTVLVTSDTDWFYDSKHLRPDPNAPWIDHKTDDLTAWLSTHT